MADVKLTPEALASRIADATERVERYDRAHALRALRRGEQGHRVRAHHDLEMARLAARALRAREWCERNHNTAAVAIVAAILNGETP